MVYLLKYFFYAVDNAANEIYEVIEYFDSYFKDIFLLIKFRSLQVNISSFFFHSVVLKNAVRLSVF